MKTIESVILDPIKKDLVGHSAIFQTRTGVVTAENIADVDLDSYGRTIRVTAEKISYRLPGHKEPFEVIQYRFHTSAKYSVTE